jgi:hypothetical protein
MCIAMTTLKSRAGKNNITPNEVMFTDKDKMAEAICGVSILLFVSYLSQVNFYFSLKK